MNINPIEMTNLEDVRRDDSGVTAAYFSLKIPTTVSNTTVEDLKQQAIKEKKDLRICLHPDGENIFHNMVLVQHRTNFHPPHKHPTKPESYHLIEGELGAIHFDEDGNITKACKLSAKGNFIYRIGANEYHVVFPLTNIAIFHESKPGPFSRSEDFIEPEWGPNLNDEKSVSRYLKMIHEVFR